MSVHPYPALARRAVAACLVGIPLPTDGDEALWGTRQACFVSIKTTRGALRGCIGTILPTQPSLDREIVANAVSAATRDPRFPPMRREELDGVRFSVDVLGAPERVSDLHTLDPARWGVIVSKGMSRGVLLPDLEGVDTVEQQLDIAMRKAGIASPDGMTVERFAVQRYPEE